MRQNHRRLNVADDARVWYPVVNIGGHGAGSAARKDKRGHHRVLHTKVYVGVQPVSDHQGAFRLDAKVLAYYVKEKLAGLPNVHSFSSAAALYARDHDTCRGLMRTAIQNIVRVGVGANEGNIWVPQVCVSLGDHRVRKVRAHPNYDGSDVRIRVKNFNIFLAHGPLLARLHRASDAFHPDLRQLLDNAGTAHNVHFFDVGVVLLMDEREGEGSRCHE